MIIGIISVADKASCGGGTQFGLVVCFIFYIGADLAATYHSLQGPGGKHSFLVWLFFVCFGLCANLQMLFLTIWEEDLESWDDDWDDDTTYNATDYYYYWDDDYHDQQMCNHGIVVIVLAILNVAVFLIFFGLLFCSKCCCEGGCFLMFLSGLLVFVPLAIISVYMCMVMSIFNFKARLSTVCALIEVIWSVVGKLPSRWIARADQAKGYADKGIKMNEVITNAMHIAS